MPSAPLSLVLLVLLLGGTGLVLVIWRSRWRETPSAPACGRCGYSVRGLPTFICPECGSDVREVGIVPPRAASRRGSFYIGIAVAIAAFALLAGGTLSAHYRQRAAADRARAVAALLMARQGAMSQQLQAQQAAAAMGDASAELRLEAAPEDDDSDTDAERPSP